jgi:hypothetical protein
MKSQGLLGPILIAAAIFIFFALVMPLYNEINAVKQAIDERTVLAADLEDALSQVKKLKSEITSNRSKVEKVSAVITGPKNSDEILVALETMANESGIDLSSIEMGQGKSEGKYEVINLKIGGASTYWSIQSFLNKMEKNTRLFDVIKVNLSDTGIGVRFNLETNVYYLE